MSSKTAFIRFMQKMPGSIVANRAFVLCLVMLFLSGSLLSQGYVQQTGTANPFAGIDVPFYSVPAFADLDSDGDLDLVLGAGNSSVVYYYRNTGTSSTPVFTQGGNLFTPNPTPSGANFYPALGDVDGDGKPDAVIGNGTGILFFYKNTGTATNPAFTQQTGAGNPFAGINIGGYAAPNLGDLDGDGDLDLIVSNNLGGGGKAYYKNTGTRTAPVYVQQTGSNDPLSTLPPLPRPVLGDIDKDGDLDIISGSDFQGRLSCFLNIGTVITPVFTDRTDLLSNFSTNPDFTLPALADLDGDGDLDLVVGSFPGTLIYLKNVVQITRQPVPASLSACSGSNVSTTIQTIGDGTRTYQWYRNSRSTTTPVPGQTGATLNLNGVQAGDAGLYYVLVGGAGVSIWSQPFTLTVNPLPAAPTVTASGPTTYCDGGSVALSAPAGFASYLWSNGATTRTITVDQSGSYTVRVTNSNGCTSPASAPIVVTENQVPQITTILVTQPDCLNTLGLIVVVLYTDFGGITYSIDGINYQARASFSNVAPGTYSVTARSSAGCVSRIFTIIINQGPPIPASPTVTVVQPTCTIQTGTITVNTPTGSGITYSINGTTYQQSNIFRNVAPGGYLVRIKDINFERASFAVPTTINAVAVPALPTITVTQPTCTASTGTITVNTSTGTGITYSINGSTYQTSNVFNSIAPGNYNVTVKNSSGCTSAATAAVVFPPPPTPATPTVSITQPTCTVPAGTITVNTPVGAGITYSIDGTNYQTGVTFSNVAPGNYTLTAKNSNGCISSASVIINTQLAAPATPSVTVTQPTCAVATGTVRVNSPSGSGITYSIDGTNYQPSSLFNNVASGSYNVTVKNSSGCVASTPVTINAAPQALAAPTVAVMQTSCSAGTGTITVTAPTGAGITYSIFGNVYQASPIFSNLDPGSYSVRVRNIDGCTSPATPVIINPQPATPAAPTVSVTQPTCSFATGTILVTNPAGADITYSINGTTYQPGSTFSNLSPGSYSVTAKSNGNCTSAAAPVTINAPPAAPALPTVSVAQPTCAVPTGTITVNSPTGANITYSINGTNYQTSNIFSNVPSGNYSVTASTNGCTSAATPAMVNAAFQASYTITASAAANSSITPNGSVAVNCGASQTFTISASAGYAVQDVLVDGISVGAVSTYTFNNVTAPHTISVTVQSVTITFYPRSSATDLSQPGQWTTDEAGGDGSVPANFTTPNQTFNVNGNGAAPGNVAGVWTIANGSNVIISGNATLELSPMARLAIGAGSVVNFNNRPVVVRSSSAGTASISTITGTLSGATNVTVERYIPARRAWRMLSAPIGGTQTINQAWQEGATSTTANPTPGYGTFITGGTAADGFDQSPNASSSIKTYSSTANNWVAVPNTNNTTAGNVAYLTFVYGNRNSNTIPAGTAPNNTTLRATGPLKTGDQTYTVNPTGFTGIPNPFASPINFATLTRSGVANTFYLWDPKIGGTNGVGGYVTVSFNGSTYDVSSNAISPESQFIQSGQGFLVYPLTSGTGGSITIKETDKTNGAATDVFRTTGGSNIATHAPIFQDPATGQGLRMNLQTIGKNGTTAVLDEVFASYKVNYANKVDQLDAVKAINIGENLGMVTDGQTLAIERKQLPVESDVIKLRLWNTEKKNYLLEFNPVNLSATGLTAYLEDRFLQTSTAISLNQVSHVSFDINEQAASASADRFRIVFSKNTRGADLIVQSTITAYPNPVTEKNINLYFANQPAGPYLVTIVNNAGQVVLKRTVQHSGGKAVQTLPLDKKLEAGAYKLHVTGKTTSVTMQIIGQ